MLDQESYIEIAGADLAEWIINLTHAGLQADFANILRPKMRRSLAQKWRRDRVVVEYKPFIS